jgi:hypothetical protein
MGQKLASLISHVKSMLPKQGAVDALALAQGGMPPGGGGMPMDPSMMMGGGGMPMDPSMMMGGGGGMPPMDPSMMMIGGGGGMPMDPSMMMGGGGMPMDPSMMMGGGMPPDAGMAAQGGAAAANGGAGGAPPKIKVDINVELLQIKKLLAAIVDALGIRVPAQDMAVTPQDVARMAQQEQQPVV